MKTKLHKLAIPFDIQNTAMWRKREEISHCLEKIKSAADEAGLCLEMDERRQERLPQASQALKELAEAIKELKTL